MKSYPSFLLLPAILLSACGLVSPYSITFTTPEGAAVAPATDTLDFVVSAPALAYISEIECEGADDVELLPVITEDMQATTAHNLALSALNGIPGSTCDVTVTAFNRTTTETAQKSITLQIEQLVDEVSDAVSEELPEESVTPEESVSSEESEEETPVEAIEETSTEDVSEVAPESSSEASESSETLVE